MRTLLTTLKTLPYAVQLLLLTMVEVIVGSIGFELGLMGHHVSMVWPPAGVSVAALLLLGYRVWPAVAIGAFLTSYGNNAPLVFCVASSLANVSEALLSAWLLEHYVQIRHSLERVRDILGFVVIAVVLSPCLGASIGTVGLLASGLTASKDLAEGWWIWWIGDAMGALTIAPLILTWSYKPQVTLSQRHFTEAAMLMALLVVTSLIVFSSGLGDANFFPLAYLTFPYVIWAALRYSVRAVATTVFILTVVGVWSVSRGTGPFVQENMPDTLLFLWSYVATIAIMALLIGAVLTQHKYAQQSLQERSDALLKSEAQNRALLQIIPDLMLRINKDGHYQEVLAGSDFQLMIMPRDQVVGKTVYQVLPEKHAQNRLHYIDKALKTKEIQLHEYDLVFGDETKYFEARIMVNGEDETLTIVRDVTEHKQAETQRLQLAIERERVHIISKFIQDASHEFRTPLSTIKTSLYLLSNTADMAQMPRLVQRITDQTDSILTLVEALVMMSQLDAVMNFNRYALAINDLLRQLAVKWSDFAKERQITLVLHEGEMLPLVVGDAEWLFVALGKLIENGLRHIPSGGKVTIQSSLHHSGAVLVEVVDDGAGIESDVIPHIFERFYRADSAHTTRGFGLGLPIARRIIEGHGGQVEVESKIGCGTTFKVILPVA